jgi:hypothetical protein
MQNRYTSGAVLVELRNLGKSRERKHKPGQFPARSVLYSPDTPGARLFDAGQDVFLVHEQVRLAFVLDLGTRILGEQHAVSDFEIGIHFL